MTLTEIRKKINGQLSVLESLTDQRASEQNRLQQILTEQKNIKEALSIVENATQHIQQEAHKSLTAVVSACLQSVFYDEDYTFGIRFERKQKKTDTRLVIFNAGHEVTEPLEAEGGGVIDVAAFVLQVSCLMMSTPAVRRVLVLDEPFKFVSAEYRDGVTAMIEMLADKFKIQFIIVTHIEELTCGTIVRL